MQRFDQRRGRLRALLLFLFLTSPANAVAQTITEFPINTGGGDPEAITSGPDGNLWFLEGDRAKVGRITVTGLVTEFTVSGTCCPFGTITSGPDGNVWFTEPNNIRIGRITTNGVITEFPLPNGRSAYGITTGPDGNLWFTEGDRVGRITPSGAITEFPILGLGGLGGIAAGPDGNLWFTQSNNGIGRITPAGVATSFQIPTANSAPIAITAGSDGSLWFVEQNGNQVGRITPAGLITEFPIPVAASFPSAITSGPDGNLWFAEADGNAIVRITTLGTVTEYPLPASASIPQGIVTGSDGAIWFTERGRNKIGRLSISQTLSIPAAASIHGAGGTFFHTDVWLTNRSFIQPLAITASYYCFLGQNCYGLRRAITLAPRESRLLGDIVGLVFSSPESAGPITLTYGPAGGPLTAYARVYTPSEPAPTYGASIDAIPISSARTRALFTGLGSHAGNLCGGFRSNFGVFNPGSASVSVNLVLLDGAGNALGSSSVFVGPSSAVQINDVASSLGAIGLVSLDSALSVTSTAAVFPYVTVIDNQSGDFVYVPASDDEPHP